MFIQSTNRTDSTTIAGSSVSLLLFAVLFSPLSQAAQPAVFAVNYPLAYFAQRLAGPNTEILLPRETVPGTAWNPSLEDILAMQAATMVLVNDREKEAWLSRVSLPTGTVVDLSLDISAQLIKARGEATHSHGPDGEHTHMRTASNPWLDLSLAAALAGAVTDAMRKHAIQDDVILVERFDQLESDLTVLDTELRAITGNTQEVDVLAAGAGYEYLARRYGLNLRVVDVDPRVAFGSDDATRLEKVLLDDAVRWMIWPEEPLPENSDWLRRKGIESVVIDLGRAPPEGGDFMTSMRSNTTELARILQLP